MRALIIASMLLFSTLKAEINSIGRTILQNDLRITILASAGWVRYFIHLNDLSKAERILVCEAPIDDIDSLGLDLWEVLNRAEVEYIKGFKNFYINNTKVFLACVGADNEN